MQISEDFAAEGLLLDPAAGDSGGGADTPPRIVEAPPTTPPAAFAQLSSSGGCTPTSQAIPASMVAAMDRHAREKRAADPVKARKLEGNRLAAQRARLKKKAQVQDLERRLDTGTAQSKRMMLELQLIREVIAARRK